MAARYKTGERVRGTVTRVLDFGAFVELEPGIEGLIHLSEMSWARRVKKAGDMLKPGETVEAVILGLSEGERRISLGLKQALGDPWADAAQRFAAGTVIEGPVTSLTKFGAFVQLSEGVEGMIHVSEISAEKRINHPQEVLKVGQSTRAQVLAVDTDRRLIRLSMKQLVPTSLEEYIAEHKEGDVVTGRILEISGEHSARRTGRRHSGYVPSRLRASGEGRNQARVEGGFVVAELHASGALEGEHRRHNIQAGSDARRTDLQLQNCSP